MIEMLQGLLRPARQIALAGALLVVMSVAPAAASTVIVNTFGPGDSYDQVYGLLFGFLEGGSSGTLPGGQGESFRLAVPFSWTQPFEIESVALAVNRNADTDLFRFSITESSGGVPGALITSWDVADLPSQLTHPNPPVVLIPTVQAQYLANTTYFLVAEGVNATNIGVWALSLNQSGVLPFRQIDDGDWFELDPGVLAYRIVAAGGNGGSEIPEPGTWALMGAGLAGLAWLRRKRA